MRENKSPWIPITDVSTLVCGCGVSLKLGSLALDFAPIRQLVWFPSAMLTHGDLVLLSHVLCNMVTVLRVKQGRRPPFAMGYVWPIYLPRFRYEFLLLVKFLCKWARSTKIIAKATNKELCDWLIAHTTAARAILLNQIACCFTKISGLNTRFRSN